MAEPMQVSAEQLQGVARSIDAFSYDLYGKVAPDSENLIMSPASVAVALGMTYAGARGRTRDEMAQVLHVADSSLSDDSWHAALGALAAEWNGLSARPREEWMAELTVALANRLYGEATAKFEAPFLEQAERDYRAPLEQVDFKGASEEARGRINDWVEQQTHDKIRDLIPVGGVNAATRIVLVNAVYFKAKWSETFNEQATAPSPFHIEGKSKVDVPTMHQTAYFPTAAIKADGVSLLQMHYDSGPFAMLIILPSAKGGLPAIESKMSPERVEGWLASLKTERVAVSMPKFKLAPDESLTLAKTLQALGMRSTFAGDADFTAMAPPSEDIELAEVFHKGFIEVDEEGTEAAAATAVIGRAGAGMPTDEPIPFTIDRPFAFMIRDTKTGAILFMGRVVDPRG